MNEDPDIQSDEQKKASNKNCNVSQTEQTDALIRGQRAYTDEILMQLENLNKSLNYSFQDQKAQIKTIQRSHSMSTQMTLSMYDYIKSEFNGLKITLRERDREVKTEIAQLKSDIQQVATTFESIQNINTELESYIATLKTRNEEVNALTTKLDTVEQSQNRILKILNIYKIELKAISGI